VAERKITLDDYFFGHALDISSHRPHTQTATTVQIMY